MSNETVDWKKSELFMDMKQYAFERLERELWLNITELHKELSDKFASELANVKGTIKGRKRSQADNLIDWIKAWLTKDENCIKHKGHYFWLPSSGIIHDRRQTDLSDAFKLAAKLLKDMQIEKGKNN